MSFQAAVDGRVCTWYTLFEALEELAKMDGAESDDPLLWGMRKAAINDVKALKDLIRCSQVPSTCPDGEIRDRP